MNLPWCKLSEFFMFFFALQSENMHCLSHLAYWDVFDHILCGDKIVRPCTTMRAQSFIKSNEEIKFCRNYVKELFSLIESSISMIKHARHAIANLLQRAYVLDKSDTA